MPSPEILMHSRESWDVDSNWYPPVSRAFKHIFVICGPAGCGKSSIAEYLHEESGFPYIEGDDLHSKENIQKMSTGQPLTDTERWDWLIRLREQSILSLKSSSSSSVLVTCSALKQKYRDVFRVASYYDSSVKVHFVFLHADATLLADRVRERKDHYMKDNMVATQVRSLELPRAEEVDVLVVDACCGREAVREAALPVVRGVLGTYGKGRNG